MAEGQKGVSVVIRARTRAHARGTRNWKFNRLRERFSRTKT